MGLSGNEWQRPVAAAMEMAMIVPMMVVVVALAALVMAMVALAESWMLCVNFYQAGIPKKRRRGPPPFILSFGLRGDPRGFRGVTLSRYLGQNGGRCCR